MGNLDPEGGAAAFARTRGDDRAAMQFSQMLDDSETKSEPGVSAVAGGVTLAKAFEQVRQQLRLDTLAHCRTL